MKKKKQIKKYRFKKGEFYRYQIGNLDLILLYVGRIYYKFRPRDRRHRTQIDRYAKFKIIMSNDDDEDGYSVGDTFTLYASDNYRNSFAMTYKTILIDKVVLLENQNLS